MIFRAGPHHQDPEALRRRPGAGAPLGLPGQRSAAAQHRAGRRAAYEAHRQVHWPVRPSGAVPRLYIFATHRTLHRESRSTLHFCCCRSCSCYINIRRLKFLSYSEHVVYSSLCGGSWTCCNHLCIHGHTVISADHVAADEHPASAI